MVAEAMDSRAFSEFCGMESAIKCRLVIRWGGSKSAKQVQSQGAYVLRKKLPHKMRGGIFAQEVRGRNSFSGPLPCPFQIRTKWHGSGRRLYTGRIEYIPPS